MAFQLFEVIAHNMPLLRSKLFRAGMHDTPEYFIRKTVISAGYMTIGILVSFGFIIARFGTLHYAMLLAFPFLFVLFFFYLLKLPDVKIGKREKEVSKELVFAGRHLVIELQSGVSLYDSFINIAKNYEHVGKYFREMVNKINLGTSMDDALTEAVEEAPSDQFRRILWQILNSIRTGSDIGNSLNSVLEQIAREQTIEVNKYGRKLNPMAMFYMIIAVILPSLGITMLIVVSSFVNFTLSLTVLLVMAGLLGFVQFMFLSIIKFSRPAVEM